MLPDKVKRYTAWIVIAGFIMWIYCVLSFGGKIQDILTNITAWVILIGLICFAILSRKEIKELLASIKCFVELFLFGNKIIINNMQKCHSVAQDIQLYNNLSGGTKLLLLENMANNKSELNIIYSHRGNDFHKEVTYSRASSSIPLTYEEKNLIMRIWNFGYNNLGEERINVICSCELYEKLVNGFNLTYAPTERDLFIKCTRYPQLNGITRPQFLEQNIISIGSNKTNIVTNILMHYAVEYGYIRHKFTPDPNNSQDYRLHKTPTLRYPDNRELVVNDIKFFKDAGIIARFKNPFRHEDRYVFVLAGCKAAGAFAVKELMFDHTFVSRINSLYHADENFEVVIETYWQRDSLRPKPVNADGSIREEGSFFKKIILEPEVYINKYGNEFH